MVITGVLYWQILHSIILHIVWQTSSLSVSTSVCYKYQCARPEGKPKSRTDIVMTYWPVSTMHTSVAVQYDGLEVKLKDLKKTTSLSTKKIPLDWTQVTTVRSQHLTAWSDLWKPITMLQIKLSLGVDLLYYTNYVNCHNLAVSRNHGVIHSFTGLNFIFCQTGPGSNPGGDKIFCLSRLVLGPTQPPVKWVPGLSRGLSAARACCWPPTSSSAAVTEE